MQAECEELKRKLADNRKELDSNEQMIRWLNNQVHRMIPAISHAVFNCLDTLEQHHFLTALPDACRSTRHSCTEPSA